MCHVSRVTCHVSRVPRQVGCVTVRVPPDIDESLSSGDVAVAEGANTTLSCVTRGQPQYVARVYLVCHVSRVLCRPTVTWVRENKQDIKTITSTGLIKGLYYYPECI